MMLLEYNCIDFNLGDMLIGTKVAINKQQLILLMRLFAKNNTGNDYKDDYVDNKVSVRENVMTRKNGKIDVADISKFVDFVGSRDAGNNDLIYYDFLEYCEDFLKLSETNHCEKNKDEGEKDHCEKNSLKFK